ncbi:MAG: hypothetical protein AAF471_02485 [Myxococcota bacterium]
MMNYEFIYKSFLSSHNSSFIIHNFSLLARVLRRKGGRSAIQTTVDYLCPDGGQEQVNAFMLKVEGVLTRAELKGAIMSFSEVFRHEGKQLGLKEGLERGKLETARNMLREGIPTATIVRVTGLTRQKLAALRRQ